MQFVTLLKFYTNLCQPLVCPGKNTVKNTNNHFSEILKARQRKTRVCLRLFLSFLSDKKILFEKKRSGKKFCLKKKQSVLNFTEKGYKQQKKLYFLFQVFVSVHNKNFVFQKKTLIKKTLFVRRKKTVSVPFFVRKKVCFFFFKQKEKRSFFLRKKETGFFFRKRG